MKTVFKRLISSLLLVVMLVAAVPASLVSAAADDIDWDYLKDKYGLTEEQIDAAKDIADELGLTKEQVDAVEDYYESLPPEEQEELKETVKESIETGELPDLGETGGEVAKKFAKEMFIATMKKAAKDVLNRVLEAMEGVTVKNPFDLNRVYDEQGNLAGVNFVLKAADDVNVLEAVKSIVKNYDVLGALKLLAGAVLLYDEVTVNGYTIYDLADPSEIWSTLVKIYKANPIEFSTIANMEGNTLATYNFSLSCRGVEIDVPVNFVINCSEATLNKIKSAAKKLADMVEVNGDFTEIDGIFSADLEGTLDISDYTDEILGYLLPSDVTDDYGVLRDKLHTMTLGDLVDQIKLERLEYVAKKLGYEAQFESLVNKIADHFNLDLAEPNDLKAMIRVIDERNLFSVYVKAAIQKAKTVSFDLAKVGADKLKSMILSLDANAMIPAYVLAAMAEEYGVDFNLAAIKPAKLKELLLSLEAKAKLPVELKDALKKAYSILEVDERLNVTIGELYNGDGSYTVILGNGISPKGFQSYVDAALNKLLSTKLEDRISKALKAFGFSSIETYVDAVKTKYNKIYTGKYDLDVTLTLVVFKTYTVTFVDDKGNVIDTQKVVAGDGAEDPYFHGGSAITENYIASVSYENVMSDLTVVLTPVNHIMEWDIVTEPTCDTDGLKNGWCTIPGCDYVENGVVIPAHDHDYDGGVVTPPDCDDEGYTTYTCSICHHSYKDNFVDPVGHTWEEVITVKHENGHTGKLTRRCQVCYIVEWDVEIPHDYKCVVTEPTCFAPGIETYTCECGAWYTVDLPALGHDFSGNVVERPATCDQDGFRLVQCVRCDLHRIDKIYKAFGHTWGEWIVEKAATEYEAGKEYRICATCGCVEYRDIAPTGVHTWTILSWTDPTCTEAGYYTYICTDCGATYTETVGEPLMHDFIYDIVEPTCSTPGLFIFYCSRCGYSYSEEYTPATDHLFVIIDVVDPTCDEEGYVLVTCKYGCGETHKIAFVPALGHDYVEIDRVDNTCGADGYVTYMCNNCGHTYTEILYATGAHDYQFVDIIHDATCEHPGLDLYYCAGCDSYEERYTDPNPDAHSYELIDMEYATCDKDGSATYVCIFCGEKVVETIPATGHAYDLVNGVFVAPTCTTEGTWTYTCVACGDTLVVTIPTSGHVYKNVHTEGINCCNPTTDVEVCINCGAEGNTTSTFVYYPTLKPNALNMAFINNILVVKIDRMTVGEFKNNFSGSITVYRNGQELADHEYVGTGCTFVCDACGTEFNVAVIADINGDGKVNSIDYMYVKRHVLGTYTLEGVKLAAADVNVDCKVSALDYARLKAHVMFRYHIYENFPAWESINNMIFYVPAPELG